MKIPVGLMIEIILAILISAITGCIITTIFNQENKYYNIIIGGFTGFLICKLWIIITDPITRYKI